MPTNIGVSGSGNAVSGQLGTNTGLNGLSNAIMGGGVAIQGPSSDTANTLMNQAYNTGAGYQNASYGPQAYTQNVGSINNPYQGQSQSQIAGNEQNEQGLAGYYNSIMNGTGPTVAQNQFQQSTDAGLQANFALARSATGGAAGQAGAMRQAQQQNATTEAGAAAQSGIIRAQEAQQAAQAQSGVYNNIGNQMQSQYSLEQQNAQAQAQNALTNQQQQNSMRQGYGQLGLGFAGQSNTDFNDYNQQNLATQTEQVNVNNSGEGGNIFSGIVGAIGGAASAF